MKRLFVGFASILATLLLLELGVAFLVWIERLPLMRPSYSLQNATAIWRTDLDPAFGVWHPPNARYRHQKACFDVEYLSNSYGARDRERSRSDPGARVVVLGDSFVEGYGVERHQRLTDLLESATALPHLNFATTGTFGPTQYMRLYETLASGFDHSAVMVGVLPDNDFDDIENGKISHDDRYRPYLVGEYPDYELVYFQPELEVARERERLTPKRVLREFSYSCSAFHYARSLGRVKSARKNRGLPRGFVGYEDYTTAQLDRLRYALERIVAIAGERPVLVFSIPRRRDLEKASRSGSLRLSEDLRAMAGEVGFEYVDLLRGMSGEAEISSLFHSCDGHWSAKGNGVAAGVLARAADFYAAAKERARAAQASSKM